VVCGYELSHGRRRIAEERPGAGNDDPPFTASWISDGPPIRPIERPADPSRKAVAPAKQLPRPKLDIDELCGADLGSQLEGPS
jgi:hypothetical protein